jgi:hypothetical protein
MVRLDAVVEMDSRFRGNDKDLVSEELVPQIIGTEAADDGIDLLLYR